MSTARSTPGYSGSHALVVGIDEYQTATPLGYAVSDARAVAELLQSRFSFPAESVAVLLNEEATKQSISRAFFALSGEATRMDDRVVVFFAGHGHTARGHEQEAGFLVPVEGDIGDLSTLIRWSELTQSADLIRAKHVLFLVDACYGGLAVTRAPSVGSRRFLRDVLARRARQVLAAGKADQVVADLGGPLPNHSVFTGHLLQALDGDAMRDGIMTANTVMAHVYQLVGRDCGSQQTPHYGNISGDGDLVFEAPPEAIDPEADEEVLYSVPAAAADVSQESQLSLIDVTKELLAEETRRIKLHDHVADQVRVAMERMSPAHFPLSGPADFKSLGERLAQYEAATADLRQVATLVGRWRATTDQKILTMPLTRIANGIEVQGGLTIYLAMRWYPVMLLLYCAGMATLAADDYVGFRALLECNPGKTGDDRGETMGLAIGSAASELHDVFKHIDGYQRRHTPRSDYLLTVLQPEFDDLLFLGEEYESLFDRFEVLYALDHASRYRTHDGRPWGPVGRFGWKRAHRRVHPYGQVCGEAERLREEWPPIAAGMFSGSYAAFEQTAREYAERLNAIGFY